MHVGKDGQGGSPPRVYQQLDIALCGLFIPDDQQDPFKAWMQKLRDSNITIPEIGLDNLLDFGKVFGYGIKEKVPF